MSWLSVAGGRFLCSPITTATTVSTVSIRTAAARAVGAAATTSTAALATAAGTGSPQHTPQYQRHLGQRACSAKWRQAVTTASTPPPPPPPARAGACGASASIAVGGGPLFDKRTFTVQALQDETQPPAEAQRAPVKMLFINMERVVPVPEKAQWLSSVVPGPYTTMRTIDGSCIVEFRKHMTRLVKATQAVVRRVDQGEDEFKRGAPHPEALQVLQDVDQLTDVVLNHLRTSLRAFHQTVTTQSSLTASGAHKLEKRITVLLNWGMSSDDTEFIATAEATANSIFGLNTWVYVEELPPLPRDPVHVVIRRRPPEARMYEGKDSKWVIQRQRLEAEKGHANEVVLSDEEGRLLEGTQTNFYAVIDGVVWTAGDEHVLAGTIREIVLLVCEENGIPVKLEPPPVNSHRQWEGAFITSTSRLVLPIASIDVFKDCLSGDCSEDGSNRQLAGSFMLDGHCPTVTRIRQFVLDKLRRHSHDLGVECLLDC